MSTQVLLCPACSKQVSGDMLELFVSTTMQSLCYSEADLYLQKGSICHLKSV